MKQPLAYYDAAMAIKDKSLLAPGKKSAFYKQLIKSDASGLSKLDLALPTPLDLQELVDDGIAIADVEEMAAPAIQDGSLHEGSLDGEAGADADAGVEPGGASIDRTLEELSARPGPIERSAAEEGQLQVQQGGGENPMEDAGIAIADVEVPSAPALVGDFVFPEQVEDTPLLVEDFAGVRADGTAQQYMRLRVRCRNPAHHHCNLSRVVAPSTTRKFGKKEVLAYVAVWLSRRNAFANREAHMAWRPKAGDVRRYVDENLASD